jgi:hypothetical protein
VTSVDLLRPVIFFVLATIAQVLSFAAAAYHSANERSRSRRPTHEPRSIPNLLHRQRDSSCLRDSTRCARHSNDIRSGRSAGFSDSNARHRSTPAATSHHAGQCHERQYQAQDWPPCAIAFRGHEKQ